MSELLNSENLETFYLKFKIQSHTETPHKTWETLKIAPSLHLHVVDDNYKLLHVLYRVEYTNKE
jgi:hypothetical protein